MGRSIILLFTAFLAHHQKIPLKQGNTELMLSFPRLRRGKDKRQLYSVPDITLFILVRQRDNHIKKYHDPNDLSISMVFFLLFSISFFCSSQI